MDRRERMQLRFMERVIERINGCMAEQYLIRELLFERGIVSREEYERRLGEARVRPELMVGRRVLREMLKEI